VGYPLIPLNPIKPDRSQGEVTDGEDAERPVRSDYVGYIRKLEEMLIHILGQFKVTGVTRPGKTGVWIPQEPSAKIAAIGVKVDVHGVTRHGFALNVNPDMEYWNGIIPCGLPEPVVSLADLLDPVPAMAEVKQVVSSAFCPIFENS
jgi:lipoate-protein ligase B